MRSLRGLERRPAVVIASALTIRATVLFALVEVAGPRTLASPFEHLRWSWVALIALAELLTYPAYAVAYRSIARLTGGLALDTRALMRIVVAGFGPVAVSGGSDTDGALSAMEWAVLAPVTGAIALGLLLRHANVSASLLWPWLIGVPVVAAAAAWATATSARMHMLAHPGSCQIKLLERSLSGLTAVKRTLHEPRRHAGAWTGMTVYWACEIAALYGALRAVHLDLSVPMATIAYSTGCLGSRRSLPLGGAGVSEALFVLSLDQLHQPLGPAVLAVCLYRFFNFLAGIVPALIAQRQLIQTTPTAESLEPK